MLLALKFKTAVAAVAIVASPIAISVLADAEPGQARSAIETPAMIDLKPGSVRYFAAGEFTRNGKPVDTPVVTIRIGRPLAIMKNQVSAAEYQSCVDEGACASVAVDAAGAADRPAVMVSWRDAQAYAAWLSRKLRSRFRLPTDEEWTYAAGNRAPDESPSRFDSDDPSAGWLARYEREARQQPVEPTPQPIGTFGANENGLTDLGGNVWEWTDTCFTRTTLDDAGKPAGVVTVNCGVRAVEGRHRTYVSDFIRDARAGGCAVGVPPSNLGFRLVRDNQPLWWMF